MPRSGGSTGPSFLPLARPPLAALATLQFTWIYNDFFWALVLMTTGAKRPITSALQNLSGTFFTDNNLIAAGSLLAAIPTLIVFMVLQRQFVAGSDPRVDEGVGEEYFVLVSRIAYLVLRISSGRIGPGSRLLVALLT